MSVIAAALKHLMDAGASREAILAAVADMEAEMRASVANDPVAEKRRAYDRQRKAEKREEQRKSGGSPVEAADIADTPLSRPPNENISNPSTHTPDEITPRARKADPFPRPHFAEPQHWADILAARKLKRLPNTASAHAKLLRDVEKWTDDDWPPGRIIQHAAEKGWGAIYNPRNSQDHRNGRSIQPANDSLRGSRPDPALDMWRAADAEERAAAAYPQIGGGAWAALPPERPG